MEDPSPIDYIYKSDAFIASMCNYAENYEEIACGHGWIKYPYPSGFGYGWKLPKLTSNSYSDIPTSCPSQTTSKE